MYVTRAESSKCWGVYWTTEKVLHDIIPIPSVNLCHVCSRVLAVFLIFVAEKHCVLEDLALPIFLFLQSASACKKETSSWNYKGIWLSRISEPLSRKIPNTSEGS